MPSACECVLVCTADVPSFLKPEQTVDSQLSFIMGCKWTIVSSLVTYILYSWTGYSFVVPLQSTHNGKNVTKSFVKNILHHQYHVEEPHTDQWKKTVKNRFSAG